MNGVITTILGVILGACITYFFAIALAKRNDFKRAAFLFRRAFEDEILALQECSGEQVFDILEKARPKHRSAVFEFRWFLKSKDIKRFDLAWKEYYYAPGEQKMRYLEQYSDKIRSNVPRGERRSLAIKRINNLLSFADPKESFFHKISSKTNPY